MEHGLPSIITFLLAVALAIEEPNFLIEDTRGLAVKHKDSDQTHPPPRPGGCDQ